MTDTARRPGTRRRELLDLAADLFAERGFANVTIDEIGLAAGVSGPALYHHFAGKEALLGEMLIGISQHLLAGGQRLAIDPRGLLRRLILYHCEFAVDQQALITVHFRELIHASADDQRGVRRLQARYVAIWTDALVTEHPALDARTARAAVHAAFGLINSTPHSVTLPKSRMVALLATMATAALQGATD